MAVTIKYDQYITLPTGVCIACLMSIHSWGHTVIVISPSITFIVPRLPSRLRPCQPLLWMNNDAVLLNVFVSFVLDVYTQAYMTYITLHRTTQTGGVIVINSGNI